MALANKNLITLVAALHWFAHLSPTEMVDLITEFRMCSKVCWMRDTQEFLMPLYAFDSSRICHALEFSLLF